MLTKLNLDRHFLFLHGERLAVFTERILRNTQQNPNMPKPAMLWEDLKTACEALRQTLEDPTLKRKDRTDAIREKEAPVLVALNRMADYVEQAAPYKSDVFTTGFRPQTEHRKLVQTVRRRRMSARLEQLEDVA